MVIREEAPEDGAAIHRLNAAAFEADAEARLVDALRAAGALTLSLVAEVDGEVVGHGLAGVSGIVRYRPEFEAV